jgi:D-tyrosyl-tRNA(Tyr) deacylase
MRIVLQRVAQARVEVDGDVVGEIQHGLLLLVGIGHGDTQEDASGLARKIAGLRIFADAEGKMNRSVQDVGGQCLAVSQFTLYGNCKKGFRPGFTEAAPAEEGLRGYKWFVEALREEGVTVAEGIFQADMQVHLVNDGPVTLILERGGSSA